MKKCRTSKKENGLLLEKLCKNASGNYTINFPRKNEGVRGVIYRRSRS